MIGTTLAHYRITAALGAGGMGEVWRAEDEKLGREVALKVLPADVAGDEERLSRFEREAKVLASLNHPNIAHLYGLETIASGTDTGAGNNSKFKIQNSELAPRAVTFLIMELVEGEDLSERISRGPIPIEEAIPIALQIAEALEAAHESGIVHRDLKPANIKLTEDGTVKVLDFGLAKAWENDHGDSSLSLSPTMTQHATLEGVILGTAAYMSPEQARGKRVDRRADIWAFGVVLWEMLTGSKLFEGETVSDVMAAVLTHDLDLSELSRKTPSFVRHLIERCLRRDPRSRIRDIGDVRIVLEEGEISSWEEPDRPVAAAARPGWPVWLGWVGLVVMAGAITIWNLFGAGSSVPTVDGPVAVSIMLPPEMSIGAKNPRPFVAISPDGSEMVVAAKAGGASFLYRRSLGASDFERLDGTENSSSPFYSPDGRWIGFNSEGDGKLKKISLDGGQVTTVAEADWGGGSWGEDDTIVYTRHYTDGLWKAAASGGDAHELTRPDPALRELNHSWPDHIPGTDAVIFTSFRTPMAASRTEVLDTVNGERRVLIENALFARYAGSGHLVFVRDGVILAAPFDRRSLELTGSPVPVVEDAFVAPFEGNSQFAVSDNGVAVWIPGSILQPPSEVVLVDRHGQSEVLLEANRSYMMPAFSPDGRKLALTIDDGNPDVWVYEMGRRVLNRLTFSTQSEFSPLWYPDGRRIVFVMDEPIFNLYSVPEDGSSPPQELLKNPIDSYPDAFTPDGKRLVIRQSRTGTDADLEILSLGEGGETTVFRSTPFSEKFATVSPDGRFLAYQSNESGRPEIYIQNLDGGGRVQVTRSGGIRPRWGRSSELFFRRKNETVAVPVRTAPELELGEPVVLFDFAGRISSFSHEYDVSADGQTFVFTRIPEASRSREIRVFLNWFAELERLAGGAQ